MVRRMLVLAAAALLATQAAQADSLKVAIPQKGNWDTGFVDYGIKQGFFKDAGLDVETVYTQGGSQTIQEAISGSVDIAMGTGILGILGAYSKGAPVRVISAEMTGAGDLIWYVKADSPIKTLKDTGGHTVSFSEAGSSSNLVLLAMLQQAGVTNAKPVSVGGIPNARTQVMSGQIDVGWSGVPFGLTEAKAGEIRIIARGLDSDIFKNETVRVNFLNTTVLAEKKAAIDTFNKVYAKTIAWSYSDPKAIDYFAEATGVSHDVAQQARDEYLPPPSVQPYEIKGLDLALQQAADFKFTAKKLTPEDVAPLFSDMMKKP